VLPSIIELKPRADHQVGNGAGNEHFARLGHCLDARSNMDSEASNVRSAQLDLASVNTRPNLYPEAVCTRPNRLGTTHRPSGTIEGRQNAITRFLYEPTPLPLDLALS
jgi:hypothetical protein